jgi:hypothetical protein
MESCPKCSEFSQRLKIHTPNEYQDIARQLIEVVRQGTFLLVRADCPLEEILEPSLPGDFVAHEFECFACGRKFRLAADTYHGNVNWIPGELPATQRNPPKPN